MSPSDRPAPACAVDGSKLLIGPSHFGSRQTTVFSLLVDGESPRIVPPQQSLVDVRIEHGDGQTPLNSIIYWFGLVGLLWLAALGINLAVNRPSNVLIDLVCAILATSGVIFVLQALASGRHRN